MNQTNLFRTKFEYPTLYAETELGSLLEWNIVVEGNTYYTIAGHTNGRKVRSKPTICEGKNIGKANATSAEEQAIAEAEAKWKKKLKRGGYWEDPKDVNKALSFIEPMLAYPLNSKKTDKVTKKVVVKDRTNKIEWPAMLDRKYNGMRQVTCITGPYSRRGEPIVSAPHVYEALDSLFKKYPKLVLDGELYNHDYRHKLNELTSIVRTTVHVTPELLEESKQIVRYYVYDGYGFDNVTENTGCEERRKALTRLLKDIPYVVVVPYYMVKNIAEAKDKYQEFVEDGYEGAIIRNAKAPYQHKRTDDLIKLKPFEDLEAEIVDITDPGSGNWGGTGKIITFRLNNGKTFNGTFKGCFEDGVQLLKEKNKWIGRKVTIVHNGWTGLGTPNYATMDIHNCLAGDR
jgi:DNA ligase-1